MYYFSLSHHLKITTEYYLGGGNLRLLVFSRRMKGWMGQAAGVDISVDVLSLLQDPTLLLFVFPLRIG